MSSIEGKDYRLVLVANTPVGLIGLKETFVELKNQRGRLESVLKQVSRRGK